VEGREGRQGRGEMGGKEERWRERRQAEKSPSVLLVKVLNMPGLEFFDLISHLRCVLSVLLDQLLIL
jgi:hypothetical protein